MAQETYIIGDVHGALKALRQIIHSSGPDANSKLIFLGDYVDGLPESTQVIDFLMELDERFQCIFLKGNHDIWLQEWLETGNILAWEEYEEQATNIIRSLMPGSRIYRGHSGSGTNSTAVYGTACQ